MKQQSQDLQFSSFDKEIPVTPEVLTEEELLLEKQADLYHNTLFTVIPRDHNSQLGIFPEDQGFNRKYVFLWHSYKSLLPFSSEKWKKLKVKLPPSVKFTQLRRLPSNDGYALHQIPNTWTIEEQDIPPFLR